LPFAPFTALPTHLADLASHVDELRTPREVLEQLHNISTACLPLSVLGAARIPLTSPDWAIRLGTSAFLHKQVPKGWWVEFESLARAKPCPVLALAKRSIGPRTWGEAKQLCDPIGTDRWANDLALKYGMRDGLICPVGGRWVVIFWSRKDLSKTLTHSFRHMLFAAASIAALRLDRLTDANLVARPARLTPRELAVLRLVSTGLRTREVAQALRLSEETVRTHLKSLQTKLGVQNRAHAVAEALRQNLIA
jgi:DNA-binding CsgD family transcriptional regulator